MFEIPRSHRGSLSSEKHTHHTLQIFSIQTPCTHRYVNRRCSFLDSLPGFNFNVGLGEYLYDWEKRVSTDTRQLFNMGKEAAFSEYSHRACTDTRQLGSTSEYSHRACTDTRQLGSTLMTTMIREVEDFCDPAIKENWSLKPHQQVTGKATATNSVHTINPPFSLLPF